MKRRVTDFELGWLVALLEGEGCFSYERSQRIQMVSTDEDVIVTYTSIIQKITGKEINIRYTPRGRDKPQYNSSIHGTNARVVMHLIVEHMHSRRRAKIWQVLNGFKDTKKMTLAEAGLDIQTLIQSHKEVVE